MANTAPVLEQTINATQAEKAINRKKLKNGRERLSEHNLNPLQKSLEDFISTHVPPSLLSKHATSLEEFCSSLPKRYTIYEPMLLLPLNVFTHPPAWGSLYESLGNEQRKTLYASIANAFSRFGVTHIAMNAPIVLTDSTGLENRMRSPTALVPLHGDFGCIVPASGENGGSQPSETDFREAFWVCTVQNQGIVQVWAPLYTMFSRGNITEKARILGTGTAPRFEGLDGCTLGGETVEDVAVVDMYAGIGYFVFSYLRRGVKRVWGWEINGWSVEGLRRGCLENGWGCRVIRVRGEGRLSMSVDELVKGLQVTDRVVIFHGDNGLAAGVMEEVRAVMERMKAWTSIRHINLGLLPSSRDSWKSACSILDKEMGGWAHVHENVDVHGIEAKKTEITVTMGKLWAGAVECRHVEQVKTYAPGVMHCVFDVKLSAHHEISSSNTTS
ncbi:S-adenosyl-L-methionine-dependent methyltransferase [Aspergillus crustosus]